MSLRIRVQHEVRKTLQHEARATGSVLRGGAGVMGSGGQLESTTLQPVEGDPQEVPANTLPDACPQHTDGDPSRAPW